MSPSSQCPRRAPQRRARSTRRWGTWRWRTTTRLEGGGGHRGRLHRASRILQQIKWGSEGRQQAGEMKDDVERWRWWRTPPQVRWWHLGVEPGTHWDPLLNPPEVWGGGALFNPEDAVTHTTSHRLVGPRVCSYTQSVYTFRYTHAKVAAIYTGTCTFCGV